MKEQFRQYAINLYQNVPTEVYEGLLSIFCLGAIGLIAFFGWKKGWKKVVGLLLAEYVFLIYCSTVIYRKVAEGVVGHNFSPFWSYEAIKNGREDLIAENIMNVVVFVPVGILLGLISRIRELENKAPSKGIGKTKGLWRTRSHRHTLLPLGQRIARISLIVGTGLIISGSIEALQYFLKRGFSEFDDVFHNTLGCLIGFMIVAIIQWIWSLHKRYSMS